MANVGLEFPSVLLDIPEEANNYIATAMQYQEDLTHRIELQRRGDQEFSVEDRLMLMRTHDSAWSNYHELIKEEQAAQSDEARRDLAGRMIAKVLSDGIISPAPSKVHFTTQSAYYQGQSTIHEASYYWTAVLKTRYHPVEGQAERVLSFDELRARQEALLQKLPHMSPDYHAIGMKLYIDPNAYPDARALYWNAGEYAAVNVGLLSTYAYADHQQTGQLPYTLGVAMTPPRIAEVAAFVDQLELNEELSGNHG